MCQEKVHGIFVLFHIHPRLYNAPLINFGTSIPKRLSARVVKLVDTTDLKSVGLKRLYRFDSGLGHHKYQQLVFPYTFVGLPSKTRVLSLN